MSPLNRILERLGLAGGQSDSQASPAGAASRLVFDGMPDAIYAIGDVHGELDLLRRLEDEIVKSAIAAEEEAWIVLLGDLVDRGPASAGVIDHVLRPMPHGLRRLVLRGNHEAIMLDHVFRPRNPAAWLDVGGRETLASYGVPHRLLDGRLDARAFANIVESYVPDEHREFLAGLPVTVETPGAIFVHAGLRPGVPIEAQSEQDMLWYRDGFAADYAEFGRPVVHGHTVRKSPLVTPFRIAIDTGAFLTGQLTAVRISSTDPPRLLWSRRDAP